MMVCPPRPVLMTSSDVDGARSAFHPSLYLDAHGAVRPESHRHARVELGVVAYYVVLGSAPFVVPALVGGVADDAEAELVVRVAEVAEKQTPRLQTRAPKK